MALLSNGLLPGSFRGVPFAVQGSALGGGRRIAEHTYPGKDEPYAEDMGRAPRRFRLRGFLVEDDVVYLGGPIVLQRALLTAAFEAKGSGTLSHPTYGIVSASAKNFTISEELDAARRSSVEVEFVESGKRSFPSILTSSSGLLTAANLCKVALAADGVRLIVAAVSAGSQRSEISTSADAWSDEIRARGYDATALYRLAAQLPGNYGRFVGGGNVGLSGQRATSYTAATTIADLIAVASVDRVTIDNAAAALDAAITTADLSNSTTIAAAIATLVQALADSCADPADAIRLLEQLVAFQPDGPASDASVAIAGMFQRAAAASLTTAVGEYQPTSADDAATLMTDVAALLDDLATEAADDGDDQSYQALRAARVSIVTDLRTRGGSLAQIASFTFGQPLPSLFLAQRLYRDPTRADQLVGQVPTCEHPLFMPTTFQALAA
jgi:prophage DNA circulation protein